MLNSKSLRTILISSCFIFSFSNQSFACNGCNTSDISTNSLIPSRTGGTAFLEYSFINQDQNWKGTTSEPEGSNAYKYVKNQVYTAGLQYNFNSNWGLTVRAPYLQTRVKSDTVGVGMHKNSDQSLGDIKLIGHYSGFASDMSSGLLFGAKLPTGNYQSPEFSRRELQIGTGSTDVILGAYHVGKLTNYTNYFVQAVWQKPVDIKKDYRPGDEVNAVIGANYNFGSVGEFSKVSPLLQLVTTVKGKDKGLNAELTNSGYVRVSLAPGIELETENFKFYADVSLPMYTYTEGVEQLAISEIFKFVIGYKF